MKRVVILLVVVMFLFPFAGFAGGDQEGNMTVEQWEEWAGLGPYTPEEDDWDAIIAAAKEEGEVTIYANTSRVFDFARSFYKEYGIKVIANDMSQGSLFEKLNREIDAGIRNCDVVLVSDTPTQYYDFFELGKVYRYVPVEILPLLNEYAKDEPLGIQRFGGKAIAFNTQTYPDGPPIDTWWDLTRPEWKDKVITKDPMLGGSEINFFASFARYADEMEALYEEEFGEPLVLNGTENAGYEFLKRLMDNGLILMSSGTPVTMAVGAPRQDNPPLGIIGPSKLRLREDSELYVDILWDVKPVASYLSKQAVSIPLYSEHPNAAKLLIRWLYGDENGGQGFQPFFDLGTWSPRIDVPQPFDQKELAEITFWIEDAEWLYSNVVKFRDFWIQNM
ncbi:MAG: ABC transporter substrate-binding protein [Spirochaetales bacterium]|nr:ABC transporter substrate-binding protein [Spirochaetales bacterium]